MGMVAYLRGRGRSSTANHAACSPTPGPSTNNDDNNNNAGNRCAPVPPQSTALLDLKTILLLIITDDNDAVNNIILYIMYYAAGDQPSIACLDKLNQFWAGHCPSSESLTLTAEF